MVTVWAEQVLVGTKCGETGGSAGPRRSSRGREPPAEGFWGARRETSRRWSPGGLGPAERSPIVLTMAVTGLYAMETYHPWDRRFENKFPEGIFFFPPTAAPCGRGTGTAQRAWQDGPVGAGASLPHSPGWEKQTCHSPARRDACERCSKGSSVEASGARHSLRGPSAGLPCCTCRRGREAGAGLRRWPRAAGALLPSGQGRGAAALFQVT